MVATVSVVFASAGLPETGRTSPAVESLDEFFREFVMENEVPGLSVLAS